MYNHRYQHRGSPSRLRLALVLLFPAVAVLFGQDAFAIWTPLFRLVPTDLLAGVIVLVTIATERRISLSPVSWALVVSLTLFGLVGLPTLAYLNLAGIPVENGRALVDIVRYPLYASAIACSAVTLQTRVARERYLQTLVIATALATVAGLGQFLAIEGIPVFEEVFMWDNIRGHNDRVAATFRWQGPLVLWYGVLLPIVASLAVMETDPDRYRAYLALFGGGVLVTLFSGSRSGLLVLPLALVPFLIDIDEFRVKHTRLAALGALVVVLVGGIVLLQVGAVARLVGMMFAVVTNPTGETRFTNWMNGLHGWWTTSPIFGVGPRNYIQYSYHNAHNSYIAALVERGVFGFALILAFVAVVLKMAADLVRERATPRWPLHVALAAGLVNYLGYMMVAEGITYRVGFVYLVFAVAVYDASTTDRLTLWLQDIRARLDAV